MKYFFLAIISVFCSISYIFPDTTNIAIYYYERMPFFGQVDTHEEGLMLAIAREIFKTAGIPYHFEKMPVSRIFETVKINADSCFPGVFRNPDREKIYLFSDLPIYQDTSPHFVIRKSTAAEFEHIQTIKDLLTAKKMLGVVEKYSYGSWVDENIKKYQPDTVSITIGEDQKLFYRMLAAGRFDYFFSSLEEANYLINSVPENKGVFLVKELTDAPAGNIRWMIFNRDFPADLLARINKAIGTVTASEEYRKIIQRNRN